MQLQLKPQKAAEIMYLEGKKQQTKYHVIYLRGLEIRIKSQFIFRTSKDTMKGNVSFFPVRNKQIRCVLSI